MKSEDRLIETKQLLQEIVKNLNQGGEASRLLWAVLTGLRGPDSGNIKAKFETTMKLRFALGINRDAGLAMVGYSNPPSNHTELYEVYRTLLASGLSSEQFSDHFIQHYASAVYALRKLSLVDDKV